MARMHSRKHGKSGSRRPIEQKAPSWLRYKSKEVEMLILKLAKEGNSASQIGIILRDTYGIPSVKQATSLSITSILAQKKLLTSLPEDLLALIKKVVSVKKHYESNKQDKTSLRGVQLTESKIFRLVKHYKRTGKLDPTWKYDPEKAGLYLE